MQRSGHADQVLARLLGGERCNNAVLSPLSGRTNENYLVSLAGDVVEHYVLRVGSPYTAVLGIDRKIEHAILMEASAKGIAPAVIAALPSDGHLLTKFVEGSRVSARTFESPDKVRKVAELLKDVHALTPKQTNDMSERIRNYCSTTERVYPAQAARLLRELSDLEQSAQEYRENYQLTRLCHNDLVRANFIDRGSMILLDWEYSGDGDLFFDLATVSAEFGFRPSQDELLIQAYFPEPPIGWREHLRTMKQIFLCREIAWARVQCVIRDEIAIFAEIAESRCKDLERLRSGLDPSTH